MSDDVCALCVGIVGKELPTDTASMSEKRDNSQTSRPLKKKALCSLQTSGTDYSVTRRHIPEERSRRDQRSRTRRRVMMTNEKCGLSEMTNWWINRFAHDIAWYWRNC